MKTKIMYQDCKRKYDLYIKLYLKCCWVQFKEKKLYFELAEEYRIKGESIITNYKNK